MVTPEELDEALERAERYDGNEPYLLDLVKLLLRAVKELIDARR